MKKHHIVLFSSAVLILVFVLGLYMYKNKQKEKFDFLAQEKASLFIRDYSQILGDDDAKVYLVKFSDPACETCGAFHPLVKKMMAKHPGKIKLVLRYAPFHKGADYMVKILEAAKNQGKYWETLDMMYKTQSHWASHHNPQPQLIWEFLPMVGLDVDKIKNDMKNPEFEKRIKQDLADAQALNVQKTPGFFVNGKPLINFGYKQLQALVEAEIKANY